MKTAFFIIAMLTVVCHERYGIKQVKTISAVRTSEVAVVRPQTTKELILYYAELFEVDPYVALETARIESKLDPSRINYNDKGISYGLFQIHSSNLKEFEHTPTTIMDKEDNTIAGMYLLRRCIDKSNRISPTGSKRTKLSIVRGCYTAGETKNHRDPQLYIALKEKGLLDRVKI